MASTKPDGACLSEARNHILCPECFAKLPPPQTEKCCGHGTSVGDVCVDCGKVRREGDPYWHCLGTISAERHGTPTEGT